ncbi:hypothetical protein BDQ12DRAFT_685042 [Crucibulum laeve]|uniref:Uncharacterized protein n=1 Tax=Crucibulum laeve TaxID=68775 RepID=A0A5C3LXT3_9AGAR|nr:hypothetical protein BDQ12DRAFT_685042 [Crucibulum laeve]
MYRKASRKLLKQALWLTKIKLLYARVTLTRFTTAYFFFALLTCTILAILQGVTYADNSTTVDILSKIVADAGATAELTIFSNGVLQICDGLPNESGTTCNILAARAGSSSTRRALSTVTSVIRATNSSRKIWDRGDDESASSEEGESSDEGEESDDEGEESDDEGKESDDEGVLVESGLATVPANGTTSTTGAGSTTSNGTAASSNPLDRSCILSLSWLEDVLHDAKREDVVTLSFQFWLFSMAVVTILNESLPHLGAALFGHILGTVWAGYRMKSTESLTNVYRKSIVPGPCRGVDLLGDWWEVRRDHTTPIVILNILSLVAFIYLSFMLYKVYAKQTFSRVGASVTIHRMYKLVLFLSVCLQLTGFFSLASTAMWLDKICHGTISFFAQHRDLYMAAFIVTLVLEFPWLVMGWICVRRECKIRFWVFCAISLFLLIISTMMFFSPLYRYIFISWPFFATITVTSYVLVVVTTLLAILCRVNFGKGLSHYLHVSEALEGVDFTPVYFPKDGKEDIEKATYLDEKASPIASPIQYPGLSYQSLKKARGPSVYSEANGSPIILSSTPPLISDLSTPSDFRRFKQSTRDSHIGFNSSSGGAATIHVPLRTSAHSSPDRAVVNSPPTNLADRVKCRHGLPTNPRTTIAVSKHSDGRL